MEMSRKVFLQEANATEKEALERLETVFGNKYFYKVANVQKTQEHGFVVEVFTKHNTLVLTMSLSELKFLITPRYELCELTGDLDLFEEWMSNTLENVA